jgi:uncharacterized RDD family membrane protein YckC
MNFSKSKENMPDDLSPCHSEPPPSALPQAVVFTAAVASGAGEAVADIAKADSQELAQADLPQPDLAQANVGHESPAEEMEASAWRDELTARLSRYRARRKMRPPRYPSLRLPFDPYRPLEPPRDDVRLVEPVFEVASDRALALDVSTPGPVIEIEPALPAAPVETGPAVENSSTQPSSARLQSRAGAKIIEFPKYGWEPSFEPPLPPPDQLAGPVIDRPRILEVPEFEPPPPALGGITIEPVERQDAEKRLGIDIPLQSASLARRIFANLIDGSIVTIAAALFGYIFWRVTAIRPPLTQIMGMSAGGLLTFWAAYQYLLIVYAASTPGLLAAGLELARFNGSPTSRSIRRWRVLASYLSAVSLGMGYAWVFLDEDVLCWHDRITHTYLAPKKRPARDLSMTSS